MFVNVRQNSDEWFDLRLKKATSSNFACIMAHDGGDFGKPAIEYAERLAVEICTGKRDPTLMFSKNYADRGHENEPLAVEAYEMDNFVTVTNGGFNSVGRLGDSPDGNVGEDGVIEIKTVIPKVQWVRIKKGGYNTATQWQIHGHIWLGNKKWCDSVSYCPEMPENKQLYVYRVHRDEEIIKRMEVRMPLFLKEVDKNVKLLQV